jgi:hypothetical protein
MNLPGFTAEMSLAKASKNYRSSGFFEESSGLTLAYVQCCQACPDPWECPPGMSRAACLAMVHRCLRNCVDC